MKKTLPLLVLLLLCFVACQKKGNGVNSPAPATVVVDTGYYPPLHDTAYYSGLDSFNALGDNNPFSGNVADTLLVIRTYVDSVLVINPKWRAVKAIAISDSVQYASKTGSISPGVVSIAFANHQLIYTVSYASSCTNYDYNSTFVGIRFWK